MKINTFIKVQKFIETGDSEKLEEMLKKENITFNTGENLTDGKFLRNSVFYIKGENKEEIQQKISSVLEKYGLLQVFKKY